MKRTLAVAAEEWPLTRAFRISRASKTAAHVVVATLREGSARGRGECLPYPRYGESPETVMAQIEAVRPLIEDGGDRAALADALAPGAARNALDSALLDLEARRSGQRAFTILGTPEPAPVVTAYTLTLDDPEAMATDAARHRRRGLLKLKLGPSEAADCVRAVRAAAPDAVLIVDANEAFDIDTLANALDDFAACGVAMVEQPLPADADQALADLRAPMPIGADESCHTSDGLEALKDRYQVVNIKLDKTGGPSEAVRMHARAQALGFEVMVGCMVATSLSMAPAMLLTPSARFVDLDGPLLLRGDRPGGLRYEDDRVYPPDADFWG